MVSEVEQYRLWELFAGCCQLTRTAHSRASWNVLEPWDLETGQDLMSTAKQKEALARIDDDAPDAAMLAPPCGPWSPLQEWLNGKDPEGIARRRAEHLPLWFFVRRFWDKMATKGGIQILEQPHRARSLELKCMVERKDVHRAVIHQCAFGLVCPVSGAPMVKPTVIDSTSPSF